MSRSEEFAAGQAKMVDLYHRTSPEAAESIRQSGAFKSDADVTYFARTKDMAGYGGSLVHVRVPEHHVVEDEDQSWDDDGDEVDEADKHWMVDNRVLNKSHIVSVQHNA